MLLVERVERVEELGERLLATGEELDVVDEEHVHVAVLRGEPVALALADRPDELLREVLGRHVLRPAVRREAMHEMTDRDEEVGLPEAHAAVDEQRVVGLRGLRLGDGHRRRVREAVGRSLDERLEGVLGIREGVRRRLTELDVGFLDDHLVLGLEPRRDPGLGGADLDDDLHRAADDLGGRHADELEVVPGQPVTDVGARRGDLEDPLPQVGGPDPGEPHRVGRLREALPQALGDMAPGRLHR